ncbi:MAG: S8 family serine peptidase [Actinomycetota bacterium]
MLASAAVGALVVALVGPTAGASARGNQTPQALGRYIVVLKKSAAAGSVAVLHSRSFGFEVDHVYRHALKGYSAAMPRAAARAVANAPGVRWVERDRIHKVAAQSIPTGINRVDADLSPTAQINGVDQRVNVDVAVIDTGIDYTHPDLNVYTAGAKNCALAAINANDDNGHGSHVAGTIGALDNSIGVVGVAPGARVWPVKVLSAAGVGFTSEIVCGIDYVRSKASQIEVANMSLGGGGSDDGNCGNSNNDAEHRAICSAVSAGVTFVVAAGNDHEDAANSTPAAYDEVITVSALADFNGQPGGGAPSTCRSDVDDTFANFSNYGADVDLIAPGVCINSTYMLGGYSTLSGTSMASPHVAGGAALYKTNNAGATPAQVKTALQNAGNLNWTWPSQDPDGIQEKLLNVATF